MTSVHHLFITVAAGSAIMLLTAVTLKPVPGASSPPETAALSPPIAQAGETVAPAVSPLTSDSEV